MLTAHIVAICSQVAFPRKVQNMLNSPVSLLKNIVAMPCYIRETSVINIINFLKRNPMDVLGTAGYSYRGWPWHVGLSCCHQSVDTLENRSHV